jgi:hexokinase
LLSNSDAATSILQELFNGCREDRIKGGAKIDYSVIKDNWYVVSGVDKGTEFYQKHWVQMSADVSRNISFTFTYPHDQHATYDPMVSIIAKGFKP